MMERDRNKNLLLLINELITNKMYDCIIMVGNIIKTDTVAMKKSFSIIARSSNDIRILEMCVDFEKEIRAEIGETHYNGKIPDVILKCQMCENVWIGPEPKRCCDGRDCGCMGQPIEPTVCSGECYEKLVNRYK